MWTWLMMMKRKETKVGCCCCNCGPHQCPLIRFSFRGKQMAGKIIATVRRTQYIFRNYSPPPPPPPRNIQSSESMNRAFNIILRSVHGLDGREVKYWFTCPEECRLWIDNAKLFIKNVDGHVLRVTWTRRCDSAVSLQVRNGFPRTENNII